MNEARRESDWLGFASELADEADALTLPAFHSGKSVDLKADGTVVTATDLTVERHLRARIEAAFPDHAIHGEEDGLQGDPGAPRWLLDPIDGTNNFVSGNPIWATLIALQIDGSPRVGVISAPALGHRWDGRIDGDEREARCDGAPITVSSRRLDQGEVSFGGLQYFAQGERWGLVQRLTDATRRQRGYGDFWHHALVASGIIEVAIEAAVSPWDLAAVRCVVEAAGGRFTDLDGSSRIDTGHGVCTNGLVHEHVLSLVRG
ncbi:MAG: histidinol-phosphatase [Glaciecola sp.]